MTRPPWATPSHKRPSSLDILSGHLTAGWIVLAYTVAPRYNEGRRDWQNLFAITRFRYIEALFHIFYYYWGRKKENRSLYRGCRYIEVRYIEVPPYLKKETFICLITGQHTSVTQ